MHPYEQVFDESYTLTFSDSSDAKRTGKLGFSIAELQKVQKEFEKKGFTCELIDLNIVLPPAHVIVDTPKARVLIIRQGVRDFGTGSDADGILQKLKTLPWDDRVWFKHKPVKNPMRHHLRFGEVEYNSDEGHVVALKSIPDIVRIRQTLNEMYSYRGVEFDVEGDRFYNPETCGREPWGDQDRRFVVGVQLGAMMKMAFTWYYHESPFSQPVVIELQHGDIFMLSDKAVGHDVNRKAIATLRRTCGCQVK